MSLIHPQTPFPASSSWQGKYSYFSDFSQLDLLHSVPETESASLVQYMLYLCHWLIFSKLKSIAVMFQLKCQGAFGALQPNANLQRAVTGD